MTTQTAMPPRDRVSPRENDEIDLGEYVLLGWRFRWILIAAALAGGLVAGALALRAAPQYQATARLILSPSKLGDALLPVSVATYRILVEGRGLAEQALKEFGLDKPPRSLGANVFVDQHLTVERLADSNVIQLTVRLDDPLLAPKLANRLAELAVLQARTLSQDETVSARDLIKEQLDESLNRLNDAESRLRDFRREQQVDVAKKDAEVVLDQRSELQRLLVDVEVEKARLATAEGQLKGQEQVRSVKRAVEAARRDAPPAVVPPAGGGAEAARSERLREIQREEIPPEFRAEFLNPFVNPTYELLEQQVATSRTRLSALERQKQELAGRLKLDQAQLAQLTRLYAKEAEMGRLEMEHDLAKRVYTDVATRYEQARLQVAGRSAQMQILDAAMSPAERLSRHVGRNVAVALVLSFLIAFVAVLAYDRILRANA